MSERVASERSIEWAKAFRRLTLPLGLAVVVYGGLALWTGLDPLREQIGGLSPRGVLSIVGIVLLGWALRALRWVYYLRHLEIDVPVPSSVLAFAASFTFTATPGKLGEVVKSLLLRQRYGVSLAVTTGILLIERITDLLAVLLLSVGGLARAEMRPYFVVALVLLSLVIGLLVLHPLHRAALRWLARVRFLRRPSEALARLLESGRMLLRPGPASVGLVLAVLAWSCEATALEWILAELGASRSWATSAAIFGLSTLMGALSMLPGGVGGFEATSVLLLRGVGVDAERAVAATLLLRLVTLWLVTLLGAVFLLLWWLRNRRPSSPAAATGVPADEAGNDQPPATGS